MRLGFCLMRIFSGIQPTGDKHLGNLIGGFRQYAATQERGEGFFCIVDLHSISVEYEPDDEEQDPDRNHPAAAANDEVGEALEHSPCTLWKPGEAAQARPAVIMNPNGDHLASVLGLAPGARRESTRVGTEATALRPASGLDQRPFSCPDEAEWSER